MAKETEKEKINRLENELAEYKRLLDECTSEVRKLHEQADIEFANSPYRKQLEDRLFTLEETAKVEKKLKESAERRCAAKDEYIQELKIENDRLNIELAHKICEKNDFRKECEELRARLRTAEHFNDQNNISMLAIRACRQFSCIKELEEEIHKLKNERGAGRKPKLSDKKDEIKQLRNEGMKIQELANKYGCSVGKIHKLINE